MNNNTTSICDKDNTYSITTLSDKTVPDYNSNLEGNNNMLTSYYHHQPSVKLEEKVVKSDRIRDTSTSPRNYDSYLNQDSNCSSIASSLDSINSRRPPPPPHLFPYDDSHYQSKLGNENAFRTYVDMSDSTSLARPIVTYPTSQYDASALLTRPVYDPTAMYGGNCTPLMSHHQNLYSNNLYDDRHQQQQHHDDSATTQNTVTIKTEVDDTDITTPLYHRYTPLSRFFFQKSYFFEKVTLIRRLHLYYGSAQESS